MSKVLVTGGAGFIGFHLSKALAKNHEVVISDNLSRGKMDGELKKLLNKKNVSFKKADLTKKSEFELLGTGFDFVYHLAAINGTEFFYSMPEKVLKVNILTTLNALEWFKEQGKGKILLSSSSETYAGGYKNGLVEIPTPETVPLVINNEFNPRWSYGSSKIISEILFINFARKFNFPYSIVRYHNIYGPRMGYEHVMPQMIKRILKKEDPFKIYGHKNTRAFCFIDDCVNGTIKAMESNKSNGEIIHIGNNQEEIKIIDLAKLIFELMDFNPQIKKTHAPKGSVKRRCPSIEKAKKLTGYEPKVSLKKGLKKTINWYVKKGFPQLS